MEMEMASTARLPWWKQGETAQNFQRSIAAAQEQVRRMGGAEMEARAFVSTVMVSCEAERVPAHILSTEEMCRLLTSLYNELLHYFPSHLPLRQEHRPFFFACDHDWPWHRYRQSLHARAACRAQMMQHLKALMFLCIYNKDKPLDLVLLKTTHCILMKGYALPNNLGISLGCFRNNPLYADSSAAMIHEISIPNNTKDMLHRFNSEDDNPSLANTQASSDGLCHQPSPRPHNFFKFPERCATLLHDMTHIQPFQAGNEWMSRLLMSFFMVAHDGFAFPVPIAPITGRSSEDFFHALRGPDDDRLQLHEDPAAGFRREKALLSAYILECVWESLNEVINVQPARAGMFNMHGLLSGGKQEQL